MDPPESFLSTKSVCSYEYVYLFVCLCVSVLLNSTYVKVIMSLICQDNLPNSLSSINFFSLSSSSVTI